MEQEVGFSVEVGLVVAIDVWVTESAKRMMTFEGDERVKEQPGNGELIVDVSHPGFHAGTVEGEEELTPEQPIRIGVRVSDSDILVVSLKLGTKGISCP
jgi:hypothetical protein